MLCKDGHIPLILIPPRQAQSTKGTGLPPMHMLNIVLGTFWDLHRSQETEYSWTMDLETFLDKGGFLTLPRSPEEIWFKVKKEPPLRYYTRRRETIYDPCNIRLNALTVEHLFLTIGSTCTCSQTTHN